METERNEAFKNEKISVERLKIVQDEHTKALAKIKSKNESRIFDLETQLSDKSSKMTEVETINRNREEDDFKKNSEYDKLNALMEQKVEMIEKEMSDYKIKFTAKDADFKEVNKELNRTRKEL